MKKTFTIKKILVLPIVAFVLFFSFETPKVEAQVPVIDSASIAVETKIAATDLFILATDTIHSTFQDITKMGLDMASYALSQLTLTALTNSTIRWIQSGYAGNPIYATNLVQSKSSLSDATAMVFSNGVRGATNMANFGTNFQNQLANDLSLQSSADASRKFAASLQDPYTKVGLNAQNCSEKFSSECLYTSLDDSANPYGVQIKTSQRLDMELKLADEVQSEQLNRSGGFLTIVDTSDCTYPKGMLTDFTGVDDSARRSLQQYYCKSKTPGVMVQNALSNTLNSTFARINGANEFTKALAAITLAAVTEATGIF
ncbi:MAG: hypothetical protein AAB628_00770 [Patescibacteria group bacterium]